MICRKCKNYIPDDSLYCLNCGEKVELVSDDVSYDNYLSDQVNSIIEEDEYREYIENKNNQSDYMYDFNDEDILNNNKNNFNNLNLHTKKRNNKNSKKNKYILFSSIFVLVPVIPVRSAA